jgi:hypothetical protein
LPESETDAVAALVCALAGASRVCGAAVVVAAKPTTAPITAYAALLAII